ncbi:MAG: hypothetical protein HY868_19660 [Chloroflexi bacterium]|nr:hypothetical protein [Chloroflexota bacterium]
MKRSLPMRWWIVLGGLIWFALFGCQTLELVAQAEPTPTETRPRATFTRPAPTLVPTPVPPPTQPPPPPPSPRPTTRPPTARPPTARLAPPTAVPPPPTPDLDAGYFYRVTRIVCVASDNTRVEGTVSDNKALQNGIVIRVSGSPHGPPAVDDATTGINPADYKRADPTFQGKYRLGLSEGQHIEGNWFVFVINSAGEPMSRNANVQTTSTAGCNTATIDFAH